MSSFSARVSSVTDERLNTTQQTEYVGVKIYPVSRFTKATSLQCITFSSKAQL